MSVTFHLTLWMNCAHVQSTWGGKKKCSEDETSKQNQTDCVSTGHVQRSGSRERLETQLPIVHVLLDRWPEQWVVHWEGHMAQVRPSCSSLVLSSLRHLRLSFSGVCFPQLVSVWASCSKHRPPFPRCMQQHQETQAQRSFSSCFPHFLLKKKKKSGRMNSCTVKCYFRNYWSLRNKSTRPCLGLCQCFACLKLTNPSTFILD